MHNKTPNDINIQKTNLNTNKTCLRRTCTTRSSADAEAPHDVPQIWNITFEKACNRGTTFKDSKGHYNCCY